MVSTGTESQWDNIRQCKKTGCFVNLRACFAMSKNRTSGGCISVPNIIIKHTEARVSSNSKKQFNSLKTFQK